MRKLLIALVAIVSAFVLSGCGAVGAGIGAAFPPSEVVRDGEPIPHDKKVEMRDAHHESLVTGHYIGVDGADYLVQHGDRVLRVERDRVQEIRKRDKSYWALGLAIGTVIDVGLTITGAFLVALGASGGMAAMGGM